MSYKHKSPHSIKNGGLLRFREDLGKCMKQKELILPKYFDVR